MDTLSVIVPVYNEEKIIAENLGRVCRYLNDNFDTYEVIVIDDGSTDSTVREARKAGEQVKIIASKPNRGKGYAVKKGVEASKYDAVLFLDADLATPIEEIERFFPKLKDNDLVIASRALKSSEIRNPQPFLRRAFGFLGKKIIALLVVPGIKDTQCGFKLFKREAALELFGKQKIERWGFDFEIIFLANKFGFKTKEIPIVWYAGQDSKLKMPDYLRTLFELFKVRAAYLSGKYKN